MVTVPLAVRAALPNVPPRAIEPTFVPAVTAAVTPDDPSSNFLLPYWVVEAMRVRAQASAVTLVVDCSAATICGDVDLLRRILENLVDNAIRHTPEDSTVTLGAVKIPGAVEIRISDAGTGIPAELRDQVFDRFVQGTRPTAARGHGLGLAFCKLAVEAHGGRIDIQDGNPGAVFRLVVPDA